MPKGTFEQSASGGKWFLPTRWDLIAAAKGADKPLKEEALQQICRSYWPPIFNFIRADGHREADAQDLTQDFFCHLFEVDFLSHLKDQRGKFRSFLLTFLKHFLSDERARASAQKRGGKMQFISIEEFAEEARMELPLSDPVTPEEVFERRWALALSERAVSILRDEYYTTGKARLFDLLSGAHSSAENVNDAALSKQLAMTPEALKTARHRMRRRYADLLRAAIANSVDPADRDDEIRHVIAMLGKEGVDF
jgi:RNA polymerase sigma-70 factor (ECF subfamily)